MRPKCSSALWVAFLLICAAAAGLAASSTAPSHDAAHLVVALNAPKRMFAPGEPIPLLIAWCHNSQGPLFFEGGEPTQLSILDDSGQMVAPSGPFLAPPISPDPSTCDIWAEVDGERQRLTPVYRMDPGAPRAFVMPDAAQLLHPLRPGRYRVFTTWGVRAHSPDDVVHPAQGAADSYAPSGRILIEREDLHSNVIEIEIAAKGD